MRSILTILLLPLVGGAYLNYLAQTSAIDTHTPYNFLFERQSRIVTDYMEKVLKRGDAGEILPGVIKIHTEVKQGMHDSNLEVIRINLLTLISFTKHLIKTQEYPDNLSILDPAAYDLQVQTDYQLFDQQIKDSINPQIESQSFDTYTPPEHDNVYNERKKDLLDEAYDMLDTLNLRMGIK